MWEPPPRPASSEGPPVEPLAKRPSSDSIARLAGGTFVIAPSANEPDLHRPRHRAEPAEVGLDVGQRRWSRGKREVLGGADRDRPACSCRATLERADAAPARLGDDPAVPVGEPGLEHRARRATPSCRRSSRAEAPALPPPVDEVADLDRRAASPASLSASAPARLPGHPVVAERGQQGSARLLPARAPLLEDAADERRLAGRVEVGHAGVDGRLDRRGAPTC